MNQSELVSEFMRMVGHSIADKPSVPDERAARLHIKLVLEEAFELVEAAITDGTSHQHRLLALKNATLQFIDTMPVDIDFPLFVDALTDIDYVTEGTRLAFGVRGGPVFEEVHRANMRKFGGPIGPDGKHLKPNGWQPPNISKCLQDQGWQNNK